MEKFDDLPVNCQSMIKEIEKSTKVPISYVSVNNEEDDGLLRIIRWNHANLISWLSALNIKRK